MIGVGSGSISSRLLGQNKKEEAGRYASSAIAVAVVMGLLFSTVCLLNLKGLIWWLGSTATIYPHAVDYAFFILLGAPVMVVSFTLNNLDVYKRQGVADADAQHQQDQHKGQEPDVCGTALDAPAFFSCQSLHRLSLIHIFFHIPRPQALSHDHPLTQIFFQPVFQIRLTAQRFGVERMNEAGGGVLFGRRKIFQDFPPVTVLHHLLVVFPLKRCV